jgi:Tol biopolymer transport system component
MKGLIAWALVISLVPGLARAEPPPKSGVVAGEQSGDTLVTRLASTGRAFSPTFSADGQSLALVSDVSGVPQVWVVPASGGWPRLVTLGSDPVGAVKWSPRGNWLAYSVLPGGGLNSQI